MIRRIHMPGILLTVALTAAPGVSGAQSTAAIKPQSAPSGVTYVTGGVGDAQQQAMKDAMQAYNLRLTFARPKSGNYLADVKVRVDKQVNGQDSGHVLDVTSTGPTLFAKMPDGDYRVQADYKGQIQTKTAGIRNGEAKELVYYFPEK